MDTGIKTKGSGGKSSMVLSASENHGVTTSKSDRRTQARKASVIMGHAISTYDPEEVEYQSALVLDALEGLDPLLVADDNGHGPFADEHDDEFDIIEDLEEATKKNGGKSRRNTKTRRSLKGKGSRSTSGSSVVPLPKRLRPLSLSSILMEERNRSDGIALAFISCEQPLSLEQQLPRRQFCPVTHRVAAYREMKTGIPYASNSRHALEQIQERPPPWLLINGTASYWETVNSFKEK
jgi:hypothetical protein